MVSQAKIKSWVIQFLQDQKYEDYQIEFNGKPDKDTGYMSDIIFLTVKCTHSNEEKFLHVVLKHDFNQQRETVKNAFIIETLIYHTVLPTFRTFELRKNVEDVFDSAPKYFYSLNDKNAQVILIENVTNKGYRMHDRRKAFDMDHCKLILREYGKLHAISFAFRDQHPEEFKDLCKRFPDIHAIFAAQNDMQEYVKSRIEEMANVLKMTGDVELSVRLEAELEDAFKIEDKEIRAVDGQDVICHGDNWNNNYMFKYSLDDGRETPNSVMLLDWQLSGVRSPAHDLSNFLFLTCSQKELDQLEDLLHIYHDALTDRLKLLGSSTNLFTFDDLKRHWKGNSTFGLLGMVIDLNIAVKEDKNSDVMETPEILFYQRAKAAISTYFKYQEIF
ncbi:uncharacterized protein [Diabrotica undecimpunctata]|uniref:uncharacterized protein n=1 Tax=Diabrotica undecimpunctata TaxID=50387 RepID=UPI003B63FC03